MSTLLVSVAVVLSALAGVCFLAGYLWFRHAYRLHEETFFPDDATGVLLMRYGATIGFAVFGGFLLAFVTDLLVRNVAGPSTVDAFPFRVVAVGLFLLSLSTFVVAGTGYAADALRSRVGRVR